MRRMLTAGLSMMVLIAASAQAADAPAPPPPAQSPTLRDAARTPLKDLNLDRKDIPDALVRASENPYDESGTQTCAGISEQLAWLNTALGPDYDQAQPETDASIAGKLKPGAAAVAKMGVESLIPFRGAVRAVSGATAHDRQVEQAADAGGARRGFLRGLAAQKGCDAPPAPEIATIDAPALQPVAQPAPSTAAEPPVLSVGAAPLIVPPPTQVATAEEPKPVAQAESSPTAQ